MTLSKAQQKVIDELKANPGSWAGRRKAFARPRIYPDGAQIQPGVFTSLIRSGHLVQVELSQAQQAKLRGPKPTHGYVLATG